MLYLLVYDGTIIIGISDSLIQHVTSSLNATFSLKQLGQLEYFLGMEIKHLYDQSVVMTQTKYIPDLFHKTHLVEAHTISTLWVSNCKLSKHGADLFIDPTLYRSMVGAL